MPAPDRPDPRISTIAASTMRSRLQVETAPQKSARAKLIKVADKISNLRSIAHSPPADWSIESQLAYVDWATDVVAGCRGNNRYLNDLFDETAKSTRKRIHRNK